MTTTTAPTPQPALGATFASELLRVLPRLLAEGALPDDWDHRATTYDLMRFDSAEAFAQRLAVVVADLVRDDDLTPSQVRERLVAANLPFDYARLGQPLSTVFELYTQARTRSSRCVSFASVTKPWLAVVEAPGRTLPVHVYADAALPISDALRASLRGDGCELHEGWTRPLPARNTNVLTVFVTADAFDGDVQAVEADAVCFPVTGGGMLAIRDLTRIAPGPIQIIRKRTVSALLAADARVELERLAGLTPTAIPQGSEDTCAARLRGIFPEIVNSLFFCTGLAAEAATFAAVADVLGPTPVEFFYAQNGYGGTGQLISELLARSGAIIPRPLQVMGEDASGRRLTLVDRVIAALGERGDAPACVFLETPTNPELQAHDFESLMRALRARHAPKVPVIVDTTLAPLYPIFAKPFTQDWPFILVKSGSKYFTKGKATLGIVACAAEPTALAILERAKARARDADSWARASQLAELSAGLADLVPRMATIGHHTRQLAAGLCRAFSERGHDITLYAVTDAQVADGLASGVLSFYLPPAPTTYPDLVDEFVAYLLEHAPTLVRSRVSYGQSTGNGRPDVFYVINPEESTQGALSAEVKQAQKRGNVQICRISVPEHADVDGLLAAMEPFFTSKYGSPRTS